MCICTIKSRPCPVYLESRFWIESVSPVVTGQRSVIQSMYNYNPGAFGCGSEVKIYEHYHPALSSIFVKPVKYRRVRYSKQESLNQHETFVWQASLYLWRTLLQQMFDIGKRWKPNGCFQTMMECYQYHQTMMEYLTIFFKDKSCHIWDDVLAAIEILQRLLLRFIFASSAALIFLSSFQKCTPWSALAAGKMKDHYVWFGQK